MNGKLTPCRHLDFEEDFETLGEYWEKSEILGELRGMEARKENPCAACRYQNNCLPCAAVNVKLHGRIAMGLRECPFSESETERC